MPPADGEIKNTFQDKLTKIFKNKRYRKEVILYEEFYIRTRMQKNSQMVGHIAKKP